MKNTSHFSVCDGGVAALAIPGNAPQGWSMGAAIAVGTLGGRVDTPEAPSVHERYVS